MFLHFSAETAVIEDKEPSRFIHHISGKIVNHNDQDDEQEAGQFQLIYVDAIGAINEGESLFDVFDSEQVTMYYYDHLYEEGEQDFKNSVQKLAYGDFPTWNPNLLILDRLIVFPEFRRTLLGLQTLRTLIHRYASRVGLVALKPFPLQFESHFRKRQNHAQRATLGLDAFNLTRPKATVKLKRYYGRLGFKQLPKTEIMVLSSEHPIPSLR